MIKLFVAFVAALIAYGILTAVPGVPAVVIFGGTGIAALLVGSVA